jgi:hypothetical protein
VHDGVVDAVFNVWCRIGRAEKPLGIGVVLGEEERRCVTLVDVHVPPTRAEVGSLDADLAGPVGGLERRTRRVVVPCPSVPKPDVRKQVERRSVRPAVVRRDANEQVLLAGLCMLDEHVEIAPVVQRVAEGIDELIFRRIFVPASVFRDEVGVRVFDLRVLVQHFGVRVRRRRVEVVVILLDVFAVVALVAGESKEPLLEDGILLVPQRDAQAQVLIAVTESTEAVLVPAIGAAPRVIVREVVPRLAGRTVVFADGAPGALA